MWRMVFWLVDDGCCVTRPAYRHGTYAGGNMSLDLCLCLCAQMCASVTPESAPPPAAAEVKIVLLHVILTVASLFELILGDAV